MDENRNEMKLKNLLELRQKVLDSLKDAPEGRMRSELAHGKYPQYYIINDEYSKSYPNGKYLKKKDIALAKKYAQKEYDKLVLAQLNKQIKEYQYMLSHVDSISVKDIYNKLPYAKKCLIEPYVLTDEEYVKQWYNTNVGAKNTYPISTGFTTERGEIVRSKSEKMIADKLFLKNVDYKYEAALMLGDKRIIYPDFTLLNVKKREEIYLEHFGMMDSPEYCKSAIEKIEAYEETGIYLGERLFATFESSQKPINLSQLDKIIKRKLI